MTTVKTVTMRVLADAGDAQSKLDEIAAKGDELDAKSIRMSFRLDDGDAKAQMDSIRVKADELGLKDARIKVRVDGVGRAIADLTALRHEEDKLNEGRIGGGILGGLAGLLGDGGGGGGGGGGLLSTLIGPAGLAIVPALGAALVEVTGLVSGFVAAGAGAVAFGALAYPAVSKVKSAYEGLHTAQSAYQTAVAKDKIDPSKTNASAVTSAADNLKLAQKQFDALPKSEQQAADGVQSLVTQFGKLSTAFEPQAFKVFTDALQVANNLLPTVTPFANTFADSIGKALKKVGQITAPPVKPADTSHLFGRLGTQDLAQMKPPPTGWQTFLDSLHKIEGPALDSIATGIGKVAGAFGKLLTTMSGKDVAHAINIAFDVVAGTINGVSYVVKRLMNNWDAMSSAFRHTRRDIASDAHNVANAFDIVRHGAATLGDDVVRNWDKARHGVATGAHDIAGAFDTVRHGTAAVFSGGASDIAGFFTKAFSGAESVVTGGISHIVSFFAGLPGKAASALASLGSGIGGAFTRGFSTAESAVSGGISKVVSFLAGLPGKAGSVLGSLGSAIGGAFTKAFSTAESAVSSGISDVLTFLGGLPGKIKGVFASAGTWLLAAGKAIVEGLIQGIGSMASSAVSAAQHIGSSILGAVTGFLGIHSPSKKMITIGQQTIAGLLIGLQGGQSAVSAAAAAMGNAVAGPDSAITGAIAKLRAYIPKGDTGLNKWLNAQNTKLQGLAARRGVLESEIQQSEQVAQAAIQAASIMNAPGAATATPADPVTTQQVVSGMQIQAQQAKAFAQQIMQLQKMGLNATSLSQIIQGGAASGLPIAQAITSGGKTAVSQLNQLQQQVHDSASKLGDAAGPAMYQAGVDAAKGLAAGLKSQLSAVDAAMEQLAQSIVNTIKKKLKISSPSRVMADEVGRMIPAGVATGVDEWAHLAIGASSRLAASTVQPWSRGGGAAGGGGDIHVHFNGVVGDATAAARQVVQVLKQYKRNGGGAALGIG